MSLDLCHSSVPGVGTPSIAFGDPTSNASLRGYMGGIQVETMTLPAHIMSADFISGQIIVDATCTGGQVVVRGDVRPVTDNSAGTDVVTPNNEALDWLKNRRRIDFTAGPPRQLVLYEEDGVTEKARMDLTTTNGTEVLPFFGTQHERGAPT